MLEEAFAMGLLVGVIAGLILAPMFDRRLLGP